MNGSSTASQGAHVPLEQAAIANAERILAGVMQYGPIGPLDLAPDFMPTAELAKYAGLIREGWAAGRRGWSEFVGYAIEQPGSQRDHDAARARLAAIAESPDSRPEMMGEAARIVREYHAARARQLLVWELNDAIANGKPIGGILAKLAALEASPVKGSASLRERAYALRFDPSKAPPPDETCMALGEIPIAARGNLTVIQGKSKVGKSAVISAIIAAAQRGRFQAAGDTLCMEWQGSDTGAIIHLDTEQSLADWHALVSRSVTRSGFPAVSPRLVSLPLVMFARSERMDILRQSLEFEKQGQGGIDAVVIDGIADLCQSPNDEGEALEIVSRVMALSQEFHTPVFCVLHENPGTVEGKTRGHLGSELNRKAFANLRIDKDGETAISTIYGTDMRKRELPKDHGFCFAWDDAAGMHTFQGRADGVKAVGLEAKAIAKARAEWEPISAEIGTKTNCPDMTPILAAEAERDIAGTKSLTKEATMKKRMQRAEILGVLRKIRDGVWTLNPSGQSGQTRDKGGPSRA